MPSFARVAFPLNKKLGKDQFQIFEELTDGETSGFETLKARLLNPCASFSTLANEYTVDTDECDK